MKKIYSSAAKGNKWDKFEPLLFGKKLFYLKLMFLTLMSVQMNAQVVLDQQYGSADFEYTVNDAGAQGLTVTAVFQTFTASESGKLTKLELGLKTLTGTATISIMATDVNGEPTGSDLVSRTVSSVGEIATVNFPNPITITAGTKYAIKIVKATEHKIKNAIPGDYNVGGFYIKTPFDPIYTEGNDMNFKTFVDLQLPDNATLTNFTSCAEMANGSIALAPTGGVAPYIYTWTSTVPGFTNPGNVTTISGLLPGSYTCNIKDSRTPVSRNKTYNYIIEDKNPIILDAYVTNNSPTCGNHSVTISPLASIIYKNSFETSDGITLSGDAVRESFNQIKLTPDENNKNGKVIINNLPATLPSNFEVNWRFFHKQKDGADGYSFNLGNDSFPGSNEDGTNQGLAVKFKIYQQDQVSIKWNGTEIVAPVNTTLELGKWIDAKLSVVAGKITLYVNGQQIANNVTIPSFAQNNAYKIIFAARTGGASNESIIDDVTFGDFSAFEYSIDGTTYQTSNVFSNITLPADRVVPIWLKQNGCSRKFIDYIYPVNGDISQLYITSNSNCNQGTISISDVFDPSAAPVNRTFIFGATIGNKAGYNIHKGTTEIIGSGFLLTKDAQDNKGYYSFSKPEGFSKNFELNVVHSSLNKSGAEGFSINLGNLSALENETVNYENGVSSGLAIRFKTNNTDNVSMFYNNVQIGTTVSPGDLETGGANNIKIEVKGTTIKTYLNETEILTGTLPASYTTDDFANYKFAIAARTSGTSNENLIQNVQLFSLEQLQYSKDNVTFTDLTTPGVTTQTEIPFVSSDIVSNKVKIYFKFKNGCKFTNPNELNVFKSAAAPVGTATQNFTEGTTKFEDLTITTDPGYVLRWYLSSADALSGTFASGYLPSAVIPNFTTVYAVAFPIGNTTCRSPYTEVTLTVTTPSSIVLAQIGNEGDDPNTVTSVVTVAQLGQIEPAITAIMATNESAYQAYIDANPNLFASPATAAEVQAMVTAVNAQEASNAVLTQIGNEADSPNTIPSIITDTQLLQIVPEITGVLEANQTAYQAYIDANPTMFSAPATAAEVQAMITVVNAQVVEQVASNAVLTQIGNEGDAPNTVTSVVTVAQLGQISPAITGIVAANQTAYQAYIDANPALFSAPATAAEVQAMVTAVNASSTPTAPTATATQVLCSSETVASLTATGTDLKWYDNPFGGSALATTVVLTAKTYYVSQTVNGIESARTPVLVLLKAVPDLTAKDITATQTSCNVGSFSFNFTRNISRDIITEGFDFPSPDIWTTHKDAIYEMGDGMGGGSQVKLTANSANKNGQLLFAKTSRYPKAFELQFKAFMLSKSGGNGFSVNYGEISNIQNLNENGNSTGLVVRFITLGTDKVQIFYDNVQVGTDYTFTLEDGTWDDFSLFVDKDGKITLRHDINDVIFQDIQLPATYTTTPNYQWAFAGRTTASFNEHIIDQVVFLDNSEYEFSYDNTNWQTSTSFTNVPSGPHTIYARYDYNTCSASLVNGTVVVPGAPVTPTFAQVAPICTGATLSALPNQSTNTTAITGTWAPALNNTATTTYTFTPTEGQCANTATMEIVVNDCSVIAGKVYEDADVSTIDGTPLTVGSTYLSIYAVGASSNVLKHVAPVTSGTGVYTFPALPFGKYKIVIGTSADGSETASYPNVGNFSMTASAEGEAGTSGDGTPNGITFVTTSAGATVYSGSRVRADAGVDFAIKQNATLPVRLISFTGKNTEKGNELTWKTGSEINFSHFEVEKSADAKKFEKIGKVMGSKSENYEFIDQNSSFIIHNSSLFYRLKMIDLDGTFSHSKIIYIDAESQNSMVGQAYPNPAVESTKIDINTRYSSVWTIKTFDIQGKLLNTQSQFLNKGKNTVELKDLAKGMNYVQFSDGLKTEVRKVINQ